MPSTADLTEMQWSSGLCDCFDDPMNCVATCFFACLTMRENAEIISKGETSCIAATTIYFLLCSIGCQAGYGFLYKSKLRKLSGLPKEACKDNVVHSCCSFCAISQEHRELKLHGADPTIDIDSDPSAASSLPSNVAISNNPCRNA
ncbi:cell number regulator 9-like [Lycium ferocissimum]|uniref:cell number regulator 9-like n=1 Tax=Lycium ferocissimum TaxID=112874 RepID=UPI002815E6EE|nr:cell number regulator 9-like [Lycium ferocissimum]